MGPTGPTGPAGSPPEDSFASFATFADQFTQGAELPFYPVVADTTGQITRSSRTRVSLQPGYYLISYQVSVLFRQANCMQIFPVGSMWCLEQRNCSVLHWMKTLSVRFSQFPLRIFGIDGILRSEHG